MGAYKQKKLIGILMVIVILLFSGCSLKESQSNEPETTVETEGQEIDEAAATAKTPESEMNSADATPETVVEETPEEEIDIEITVEEESTEPELKGTLADKDIDLIFFMGQSNMSGCGGDYTLAPAVIDGAGLEFRSVTDPFNLNPIVEPFGLNESVIGGIWDVPGAKRGSLVSSFVNKYFEETGRSIIAVSASAGGTSTDDWLSEGFVTDISVRVKNAQSYLQDNGYNIRNQYVVWLQGESDALDKTTFDEYKTNMDNIIRPLFIAGFTKIFVITPGQVKGRPNFFNNIIDAQIDMCKTSGYYALATTMLCAVNDSYMVDEWHYNQKVLNLLGSEAAEAVAYYTNNSKEMCIYDYKHGATIIPQFFDYPDDVSVVAKDINGILEQQ